MSDTIIRAMHPGDLDFAASCTALVGWGDGTRSEFVGFCAYDPDGCLLAEVGGRPNGICVATSYGPAGFIGYLIVREEARGRGVGRALLERGIAHLRSRGARSVFLDGVLAAVPLYERVGFRKVCRSLRFAGRLTGALAEGVRPMQGRDLPAVVALDRAAFAADRSFFLARRLLLYPDLSWVRESEGRVAGFILGRQPGAAVAAGPWIVQPGVERPTDLLFALAAAAGDLPLSVGVLETNEQAVAALRTLGLDERPDPPWRMLLGEPLPLGASPMAWGNGTAAKG